MGQQPLRSMNSNIVNLQPSTEVTITELSGVVSKMITQQSGSVWSKIVRLGGVERYEAATPTTTAKSAWY